MTYLLLALYLAGMPGVVFVIRRFMRRHPDFFDDRQTKALAITLFVIVWPIMFVSAAVAKVLWMED